MKSILLAFAMFSRIPVPQVAWNANNMRHVMAALPLVGVAVGAALFAWNELCVFLELGSLLRGTGFALLPLAVTGGIHMDGFCDTVDALASHGDVEKKRRILKDPHIGSFAAVAACAYLLAFAALGAEAAFARPAALCLGLAFVLSRTLGALVILLFPISPASGLGQEFQAASEKGSALGILLCTAVVAALGMAWLGGAAGMTAVAVAIPLFGWCGRLATRHFGGMSGDVSGWLIQMYEVTAFACLAIVPAIVAKI